MNQQALQQKKDAVKAIKESFDKSASLTVVSYQGLTVAELQEHIEKLSLFPRMGEEHPDTYLNALGFRKLVHDNHIVIYRIDQSQVVIERIVWASSNYPELFR